MDSYSYRCLAQSCIRLVRLLPGTNEDDISCELVHYTLDSERKSGRFEALSYVWGETRMLDRILLRDDHHDHFRYLEVTKNLHVAMRHLRDSELPRTLWVDAICINQNDLQERSSQVQIMSTIYRLAAHVTVWLGEEANDSAYVFDLLYRAAHIPPRQISYGLNDFTNQLRGRVKSLEALICRPWFTRIWVLQEVAAAQYISIACGNSELTGTVFLRGLKTWFRTAFIKENRLLDSVQSVLRLMDKQVVADFAPPEVSDRGVFTPLRSNASLRIAPLAELLERFHTHAATDRRDKIYALLGLSSDMQFNSSLRADYTKDWSTLFRDVVTYFLGSTVSITTWNDKEEAVVVGSGCPLGILEYSSDGKLIFIAPQFDGMRSREISWSFQLPFSGFDDNIESGDILCLMEGASHPTLIRRREGYFSVAKIALTRLPSIIIREHTVRMDSVQENLMSWSEFAPCVSRFPRQLTLVWDLSTYAELESSRHGPLVAHTLKERVLPGTWTQRFNVVRILEDVEDTKNLVALLEFYLDQPTAGSDQTKRYLSMLRHLCGKWDVYKQLKAYISQLRWSGWTLSNPGSIDPLLDFWKSEGILGFDLSDIYSMAMSDEKSNGQITATIRSQVWEFGEGDIVPVLNVISPAFAQLSTTQANTALSPLVRRYVTRLIFAKGQGSTLHPETLLNMLDANPRLFEATKMSLTILAELGSIKLELTSYILRRLRPSDREPNWEMMSFLLEESFADTASVITILQEAQSWCQKGRDEHYQTCSQFLIPCSAVLCKYLLETDLCSSMVVQWEAEPDHKVSVLQFLCDAYTSPFEDLLVRQPGSLIIRDNYPRTTEARTKLSQSVLLTAIRAVAPWIDDPQSFDSPAEDGNYPVQVLVSLQLLWSSKISARADVFYLESRDNGPNNG